MNLDERLSDFVATLHILPCNANRFAGLSARELIGAFCERYCIVEEGFIQNKLHQALNAAFPSCHANRTSHGKRISYWRVEYNSLVGDHVVSPSADPLSTQDLSHNKLLAVDCVISSSNDTISTQDIARNNLLAVDHVVSPSHDTLLVQDLAQDKLLAASPSDDTQPSKKRRISNKFKNWLPNSYPELDTEEFKRFAIDTLQASKAPMRIKNLLGKVLPPSVNSIGGVNMSTISPLYMTEDNRKTLQEHGYVIVPDVIHQKTIKELKKYLELKLGSEHIDSESYLVLGGAGGTNGLINKHGWFKIDYAGPLQQILSSLTSVYMCAAETLGYSRLMVNFYETKANASREGLGKGVEFIHIDGDLRVLLLLEQAGVPVDQLIFQIIVPLTDMNPNGATIAFADGFHHHWKHATWRALQSKPWTGVSWTTNNPKTHLLPEDYDKLVEAAMTPITANVGSLIIFNPLLPHAPNYNTSGSMRMAAYPYYSMLLSNQHGDKPEEAVSILPNSLTSVKDTVLFGTIPDYSAHPYCNIKLQKYAKNFFSALPLQQIPHSVLARCLFGIQPWSDFEKREGLTLFSSSLSRTARLKCVKQMDLLDTRTLRALNKSIKPIVSQHSDHKYQLAELTCTLCQRMRDATLSQWWHSSHALYHKQTTHCNCTRCEEVQRLGWNAWNDPKGCTCINCSD